ncbi:MAG: phosphoglycerate dehydrogenase [Clostridia bacterium]|nr:phosphoglycerate dehydrogenase [Clostridia bacterium]
MVKRIKLLNKISPVVNEYFPADRYELSDTAEDPQGIIARSAKCHDMEFGPSLLAIARAGVGYDNIPVARCTEAGICVFNTPGANANGVKELVLGAAIMGSRNVFDAVDWAKCLVGTTGVAPAVEKGKGQFAGTEVYGKTLGVIGLGAIGAMVANDAFSLGMDVVGYDPYITVEAAWSLRRNTRRAASLEELVSSCDIITIHVPLMDSTRGFMNADLFGKMKKGALLLNFARGGLVDNAALKEALKNGTVRKYITDFPDDEIIGTENCICIPHLGASTEESEENCAVMAARQLYDFLQTGNITNSVNLPACSLPPYEGGRLTFVHANIPNVISRISGVIASGNINIAHMTNRSRGEIAYTMMDVDQPVPDGLIDDLQALDGVVRVRVIRSAY